MNTTEPARAGQIATPVYMRIIFGLAAFGLTFQWFDRLGRMRMGDSAGWQIVWDLIALCFLPLGVMYFAYRAAISMPRQAEPISEPKNGNEV